MRITLGVLVATGVALATRVTAAPNYRDQEGLQINKFEVRGVPSPLENDLKNGLLLAAPSKLLKSRSVVFRTKDLEQRVGQLERQPVREEVR